jgi:hypothetical protein|nr:MAG TPA: protein of unknown function (DUF5053) [Caudoviricetes sp.]
MDAKNELKKWKEDFIRSTTDEEKLDHKKRFKAFLDSLSPSERSEFLDEFAKGARQAVAEAEKLTVILKRKQYLEKVMSFASMSYIAEHYFGKTRQWLYQRINGSIVNGKPVDFTSEELHTLSIALSEMGDMMKKTSLSIV